MDDEPVERMWCFASAALRPRISEINRRYRWARMYLADRTTPTWAGRFAGDAYVICESYGFYNGAFGNVGPVHLSPSDEAAKDICRIKAIESGRLKHPDWTETKIRRSVDESLARVYREKSVVRGGVDPEERVSFLAELCRSGPIVLLFSDGGTKSPEIGGTSGLPKAKRGPRHREAYTLSLEDVSAELLASIPYWVPVTIISPERWEKEKLP